MEIEDDAAEGEAARAAGRQLFRRCADLEKAGTPAAAIDSAALGLLIWRLGRMQPDVAAGFLRDVADWLQSQEGNANYDA